MQRGAWFVPAERFGPPAGPDGGVDPIAQLLERYTASTHVSPPRGLAERIKGRIAEEPASTPPRRFVAALGTGSLLPMVAALGESAGAIVGIGRFGALVRLQALGLVLVVVMALGSVVGSAGALVTRIVAPPMPPAPVMPLSPTVPPPPPSASPSPEPTRKTAKRKVQTQGQAQ